MPSKTQISRRAHFTAVMAMLVAAFASALPVAATAHAQTIPLPTPILATLPATADPSTCSDCLVDLAGDPLVDVSLRYLDAWLSWSAAPSTALLCTTAIDTNYQFSVVPSIALAPANSTCIATDGTISAPVSAAPPSVVPAPTVTPPAVGPTVPAPVVDIVIEQTPPASVPSVQPKPAARSQGSSSSRSTSSRSTTVAPPSGSVVGQAQFAPRVKPPIETAQSGAPSDASQPEPRSPAPQAPTSPDAPLAAQPAPALPASPNPTLNVILLGFVPTDNVGDEGIDSFLQTPDTLLVGSLLLQLQDADGTTQGLTGSSLTFRFLPAEAALLAQDGDPGGVKVSIRDATSGTMRQIPATVVVDLDGSMTISTSPGLVTESQALDAPASSDPAGDMSQPAAGPDESAAANDSAAADSAPIDGSEVGAELAP